VVYVLSAPLVVNIVGNGTVNPNYNGSLLQIGATYTMTASAGAWYVFTNWTGSLTTNGATLVFTMASNLTFTANFVPAQFSITTGNNAIQVGTNAWRVGTNALDWQTGLFEEYATVTNTGTSTVLGVRLYVGGLPSGVRLYNATGTNAGTPYVEYDSPLNPVPDQVYAVTFALEFYNPSLLPFTNTLTAVAVTSLPNNGPVSTNGSVTATAFVTPTVPPRALIEFKSIPGKTYTIIYSDDGMVTWKVATPSITAGASITQWYDDGPPKTVSLPTTRFYRVIQY